MTHLSTTCNVHPPDSCISTNPLHVKSTNPPRAWPINLTHTKSTHSPHAWPTRSLYAKSTSYKGPLTYVMHSPHVHVMQNPLTNFMQNPPTHNPHLTTIPLITIFFPFLLFIRSCIFSKIFLSPSLRTPQREMTSLFPPLIARCNRHFEAKKRTSVVL